MADLTIDPKKVRPETGAIVRTGVATEAMNVGDLVLAVTAGWEMANNTAAAGVDGMLGIVVAGHKHSTTGAVASGETISVHVFGPIVLGVTLVVATPLFTSANDGNIADATSTNARILGHPLDTAVFFFNPSPANPA